MNLETIVSQAFAKVSDAERRGMNPLLALGVVQSVAKGLPGFIQDAAVNMLCVRCAA